MAGDTPGSIAVKRRLSERQSFFGGAISTREASAARPWATIFEDSPSAKAAGEIKPATNGKGQIGGRPKGSLSAPAEVFRDEEAEKKQKRAAQLADFDLLGSEPPAVAQPRRVHTKVSSPKQGANNANSRGQTVASRQSLQQSAGGVTAGKTLPSSAVRQARQVSSGGGPHVVAPASRPSSGGSSIPLPRGRPTMGRPVSVSGSPLGANRRIVGANSSGGTRGGVTKKFGSRTTVHATKGGRKAAASRASAVAVVLSGNTGKQRAKAAWTAAVARMLPPPGSRKSDAVANQQQEDNGVGGTIQTLQQNKPRQQQQQQQQQQQSSRLLAGLSIGSRALPSSSGRPAQMGGSRSAQVEDSRPLTKPQVAAHAAPGGRALRQELSARTLGVSAGRGRGRETARQLPSGRGRGAAAQPPARRVPGGATFYTGNGCKEQARGPSSMSLTARKAFEDYGDKTFDEDLIDDGADVNSELEDDVDEDEGDWRAELRAITGYNPAKFAGERTDDRNMEVRAWGALQSEERRSAREGAREDAEFEREELVRLAAKKAKLAAHRKANN